MVVYSLFEVLGDIYFLELNILFVFYDYGYVVKRILVFIEMLKLSMRIMLFM